MVSTLTKEYPSTWEQDDVKEWKSTAAVTQRNFYLGFKGRPWDAYEQNEHNLLRVKICYAIFGPPKECPENIERIEDAYDEKQRADAEIIKEKIVKVFKESPATTLQTGIVFICCKQDANEFTLPVFRVKVAAPSSGVDSSKFVDRNCRVYNDWNDWKNNNTLPMLKYCYPKYGFYTCSNSCEYQFDGDQCPNLEFGTSPACDFINRVGSLLDIASSVTSLGTAGIGIAAMFTPLAPVVLTTSAVVGISSAIYGAGRSVNRLVDKGKHDESLTDMESVTCWFVIISTPAHFAASLTNAALASGARSGRVFTDTIRTAATILTCTVFGLDSTMLALGLANLVNKYKNDQLTTLDVLQFSISVFFFSHTLIQPKTATGIIERVQKQHIATYGSNINDEAGMQAFQKFLNDNKAKGDINSNAKIIRTINRIEDPNKFFTMASKADSVMIGGRKGKTVMINGEVRVNPNLVSRYSGNDIFTRGAFAPIDLAGREELRQRAQQAFGSTDLKETTIGGKKLFQEMTGAELDRLQNVLKNTAKDYNPDIIKTAQALANHIKCDSVNDFCALVELVALEGKGKRNLTLTNHLNELVTNPERRGAFVTSIQEDLAKTRELQKGSYEFTGALDAVYHYRKHGPEFGVEPKVYFKDIPKELFTPENCTSRYVAKDGTSICSTYECPNPQSSSKSQFGVLLTDPNGNVKVATVYPKKLLNMNVGNPEGLARAMNDLAYQPPDLLPNPSFFQDMLRFF